MHKVTRKNILNKEIIEILAYDILEISENILQNPVLFDNCKRNKTEYFFIIQCKECRNVLTHAEYWIEELSFSYVANCKIGSNGEAICQCGRVIGVKGLEYEIDLEKTLITKFPQKIVTTYEEFSRYMGQEIGSLKKIKDSNEEYLRYQENRTNDLKNSVVDLERIITTLKSKFFKSNTKNDEKKFFDI